MNVVAEGVDYSSTPNANWNALAAELAANGKTFVGRYAVYDKSPEGRGITASEYRAMTAHGIGTFLYYEEDAGWMTGGWSAGVRGAQNAMDVIRREGLPEGMPVYYSDDIPPEIDDFGAMIECLRGAASVVGIERVGLYGGWDAIDHAQAAGAARYYCQTLAWQYGRGLHPGIHLHQYGFNQFFAGTNCDLVSALQPHYGQASDFLAKPEPPPPPKPVHPPKRLKAPDTVFAQGHELTRNKSTRFRGIDPTTLRTAPSLQAPAGVKAKTEVGKTYTFPYSAVVDDVKWLVSSSGSWARASKFEAVVR